MSSTKSGFGVVVLKLAFMSLYRDGAASTYAKAYFMWVYLFQLTFDNGKSAACHPVYHVEDTNPEDVGPAKTLLALEPIEKMKAASADSRRTFEQLECCILRDS